jgi:hypothetical protein
VGTETSAIKNNVNMSQDLLITHSPRAVDVGGGAAASHTSKVWPHILMGQLLYRESRKVV